MCCEAHRLNCLPVTHHRSYFWLLLVPWILQVLWGFYAFATSIASPQMGLFPTRISYKSWRLNIGFTPFEQACQTASFPTLLATLGWGLCNVLYTFGHLPLSQDLPHGTVVLTVYLPPCWIISYLRVIEGLIHFVSTLAQFLQTFNEHFLQKLLYAVSEVC